MSKDKKEKQELQQDLVKTLTDLDGTADMEQMLKKSEIEFKVEETSYRVRKPIHSEYVELKKFRHKKYLEFVNDESMLFRKQWIKKYKAKDIDILKMELDISSLQAEINALRLKLATISIESDIKKLKTEITSLQEKQAIINVEKTELLSYSIEDQLMIMMNSYYTYLVLEKREKNKWVKIFSDYDKFLSCSDTELLRRAFYYINCLIYQVAF